MERRVFCAAFCILISTLAVAQTAIRVTRNNIQQLHAKIHPELLAEAEANATTSTTTPSEVKVGTFYTVMWTNGDAMYEFDYASCAGVTGTCDSSTAVHYTGAIVFTDAIVYANGTSDDWAASGQGPINTGEDLGVAFATDGTGSLSNCNPLTQVGVHKITAAGDTIYSYQSSCIVIALQLLSGAATNTFTLLDGSSYTAYGTSNTFIVPLLGNPDVLTYCDANDFCSNQTAVPVYMHLSQ